MPPRVVVVVVGGPPVVVAHLPVVMVHHPVVIVLVVADHPGVLARMMTRTMPAARKDGSSAHYAEIFG